MASQVQRIGAKLPRRASAQRTLTMEAAGLRIVEEALAGAMGEAFESACAIIERAPGRVIVTGMGKSGHIGAKIAATLASTGTPAFFVHPAEASHGDLGMVTSDDVILALSWSGETVELKNIIFYSRRFRVPLIAITARAESTLALAADAALVVPKVEEACPHRLAPTTSSVVQLALGDAIAIALLEARGFTPEHFFTFHPGGSLGASLLRIGDVMHKGDRLPLAPLGTPMGEAIILITQKGFGCLGVTGPDGELVGILTDGDLRRHIDGGLMNRSVDEVMTRDPKTVGPDALVATALEMLEAASISALLVVEERQPVGIIHMHDLLRLGVA
jgi:arabinose-5-phosphate isomerase